MQAATRVRVRGTLALLAFVLGACSSGGSDAGTGPARSTTTVPSGSTASSPFTVGAVPEGFELVAAGTGAQRQGWGEDCCGSHEPYTILERTDGSGAPVRVSIAGYEDSQGGFFQVSNGYGDDDVGGEVTEVDGKQAAWSEADPDESAQDLWSWPELIVDEGDDVAVSVSGVGLEQGEAEEIYAAVELGGSHATPPSVPEPPDGFMAVGSVDATGVIGLRSGEARVGEPIGPVAAHGAGWLGGSRSLTVETIPGRSVSLVAAAAGERYGVDQSEVRTIDGEQVLVVDRGEGTSYREITVGIVAPWGDVVLVDAFTDQARSKVPVTLPSIEELVAVARSVEKTTDAEWDAFVAGAPR